MATLNTNLTTSSDLSVEAATHYHGTMLDFARPNLVHAQFARKTTYKKNAGKTSQFRRWVPLAINTTPLTEGVVPDGKSLVAEQVTAIVYQYGDYVAVSDLLELVALDPIIAGASEVLGDQAGRTVDAVVRDVMATTTNLQYANGRTSIYTVKDSDTMTVTELRKSVRTLKGLKAPHFTKNGRKHYVAIVDEYTAYDLQSDTLWQDVSKYQDKEQIYAGELGRLFGVTFVEMTEAKTYANANLTAAGVALTIGGAQTTKTIPVKEAITAGEATALVGRKINVADVGSPTTYQRLTIASAAAGAAGAATITVSESITGTLAENDMIYANEYGYTGNTVHATMIFGDRSYGMIDIAGSGNIKMMVKNKGSAGTADPLDQISTIGWKVEAMACVILESDWILKVMHGASDD